MAQCAQSVQEFVQGSFVPMVASLCSEGAERVTRKNNLTFEELLRPFCRLTSEGHFRDPNNQLQVVKNLRISVNSIVTNVNVLPAALAPAQCQLLSDTVYSSQPQEGAASNVVITGDYNLNVCATTPWFENYRESFLKAMPATDHEFLNHYLACLLVVSSSEATPTEQFLKLSQEQHRIQHSGDYANPKWFIPNTLKYYVLLHDMSEGDEQRAEMDYEDIKQRYGSQVCYLLKINSRTSAPEEGEQIPDPWSKYLLKNDPHQGVSKGATENVLAAELDHQSKPVPAGEVSTCDADSDPLQPDSSRGPASVHTELKGAERDSDAGGRGGGGGDDDAGSHGVFLTLKDHDHIRLFVQEFTFRGLLPHIEKNIRQLNDQLVSRKGLSRSLFTATKKWFGGSKVPEKSIGEPKNTCGPLYSPEAPELQIRKMADLCFLVQHYEMAFSCYHTAKKDFLSDTAMIYAAGALEMAAVSAFLQSPAPRPYPAHYMDTAMQTYRETCKNMVLAERCVLLSAEILKSQGKYSEAATILIKMTSEDSDLRSALLLEQAAHCFIKMHVPMVRKFAFHMILAGHRFSKAGQRKHALRCYCQAMQVYKERGWSLAEDHINFTIGRQFFTLGQPDSAVEALREILTNDSRQTAKQQAAFLREYLYVYKNLLVRNDASLPLLPLPCINVAATRVYFGHERRPSEGEKQAATHVSLDQEYDVDLANMWCHLEEQLVASTNKGVVPLNFQPSQYCLNSQTDNLLQPLAVMGEPILVELTFRNPFKVSLSLLNLSLLWEFNPNDAAPSEEKLPQPLAISNEECLAQKSTQESDTISTEVILEFHLGPEETKTARLQLLPHRTGQLKVVGVAYDLAAPTPGDITSSTDSKETLELTVVRGKQDLKIQGPRLNQTKEDKMTVRRGPDHRLDPIIAPPMPLLEVFFLQFPTALLCGEIRKAHVEFCNVGSVPLCCLRVASTHPDFFTFGSQTKAASSPGPAPAADGSPYQTYSQSQASLAAETLASAEDFGQLSGVVEIPIQASALQPGESAQLPLWLRGPDQEGVHEIHFLFYYQAKDKGSKINHRVLRHTVFICASRSLSVQATACRSSIPSDDKQHSSTGGTLIFVDVENLNASHTRMCEFHILQVSSISQQWNLHACLNPDREKDCRLSSRERAKLCFRATRCKNGKGDADSMKKFTFADLTLGNERIVSSSAPCGDFYFLSCWSSDSKRREAAAAAAASRTLFSSKRQSPAAAAGETTSDLTHLLRTCSELDLNIIVIWKAYVIEDNVQVVLQGQLHVAMQSIGEEAISLTPKEEAQDMLLLKFKSELPSPAALPPSALSQLVKTNLHYPETYIHSFIQNSVCVVPVVLTLSNSSLAEVDVIIDLRHKNTSPEGAGLHSVFSWVGQTFYKLQLKPQDVLCVRLQACFFQAGVYNLNTPQVFAKPSDQGAEFETSQQAASPALIIINNA